MTTLWSMTTETAASRVCKFCAGGLHSVPEIYASMCEACWGEEIDNGGNATCHVRTSPLCDIETSTL